MLIRHWSSAGAALPIKEVCDIQHAFLESEALYGGCVSRGACWSRNAWGAKLMISLDTHRYETVINETEALQLAYNELAIMLNCSARNIAILQSATAAWMQVDTRFTIRYCIRTLSIQQRCEITRTKEMSLA